MAAADIPLTLQTALTSWRVDPVTLVFAFAAFGIYWFAWRRSPLPITRLALFGAGCGVWLISGCSFVGVYGDVLFWVRALQFVLILLLAPLLMALGMPLSVLRDGCSPRWRRRGARLLGSPVTRILAHPAVTSAALLVTPWLIYLTAWYPALLGNTAIDALTRLLLLTIGYGYFYARVQLDPVPRRYPQSASLLITLIETLGDGALGVVMWQGAILAPDFYQALNRSWGPSIRTDQTIGAGVFWILGDVVGLPFLMVLLGRFRADERIREVEVDRALDRENRSRETTSGETAASELAADQPAEHTPSGSGLWWEQDQRFRDRR